MPYPKLLLAIAVTATAVSAALPRTLVVRQDASFGACNRCSSALQELAPYCHAKPEEECKKACTSTYLGPLTDCATCVASDSEVNAAGKALVDQWVAFMDKTCNPPLTTYGKCSTCENVLRDLAPYCHGQTTEECNKACTPQLLDPLKTCSDCINNDNTASQDGKDLVNQWQSHMDTQCKAGGGSCTSQCSAIRPDLEAKCGPSASDPAGCRELCGRIDSASNCATCIEGLGGLPDLFGFSWKSLEWYCSNGCGSTCMGVVDEINSQCKDEASCKTAMCSGDAKVKLDECNQCLPSAPLLSAQRDTIEQGLKQVTDLCGKPTDPDPPNGTTCDAECTPILNKNNELCQGGDAAKCKGMCTDENLTALDRCNSCASGPDSKLDSTSKTSIANNLSSLRTWCKDNEDVKTNDPPIGTIPTPPKPLTPPTTGDSTTSPGGTVTPPGGGGGGVSIGAPPTTSGRVNSTTSGTSQSSAQEVTTDRWGAALGFSLALIAALMS